ncbi:MAG: hypothetical protein EAZ62_01575 [Sphingobacteriia bacterium]|nr:MAG: hypothetical protein EAZ62_01575 [Sphingobacteriia bacterium]
MALTHVARFTLIYKLSGKDYFHLRMGQETMPPILRNGLSQNNAVIPDQLPLQKNFHQSIFWYHQAPKWKYRFSLYAFSLQNASDWMRFYQDEWRSFVALRLKDISWQHQGIEVAAEGQLAPGHWVQLAVQWGRHRYAKNAAYQVFKDQATQLLEQGEVMWQGLPLPSANAFSAMLGWKYQSPARLSIGLTASYLGKSALSYNPLRRSQTAFLLSPNADTWLALRAPSWVPAHLLLDAEAGFSFKSHSFFLSIQNALNADFASGGYEQLRFLVSAPLSNLHPPKFYHVLGLQALLSWRFTL